MKRFLCTGQLPETLERLGRRIPPLLSLPKQLWRQLFCPTFQCRNTLLVLSIHSFNVLFLHLPPLATPARGLCIELPSHLLTFMCREVLDRHTRGALWAWTRRCCIRWWEIWRWRRWWRGWRWWVHWPVHAAACLDDVAVLVVVFNTVDVWSGLWKCYALMRCNCCAAECDEFWRGYLKSLLNKLDIGRGYSVLQIEDYRLVRRWTVACGTCISSHFLPTYRR